MNALALNVNVALVILAVVAGVGWLVALHRVDVWRRRYRVAADELWRWRYGMLDDASER